MSPFTRPRTRPARRQQARPAKRPPASRVTLLYLLPEHTPADHPLAHHEALAVPARALLHPDVRQPDGLYLYTLLTSHPNRQEGALVFLADLAGEAHQLGTSLPAMGIDWATVIEDLADLAAAGGTRAVGFPPLSELASTLMATSGVVTAIHPDGSQERYTEIDRAQLRRAIATEFAQALATIQPEDTEQAWWARTGGPR